MALYGPSVSNAFNTGLTVSPISRAREIQMSAQLAGNRFAQMILGSNMGLQFGNPTGKHKTVSRSAVVQPGPTQVIRPSQQPARRASAPQAGASSSLMTEAPSPAEVALATTSLLGG